MRPADSPGPLFKVGAFSLLLAYIALISIYFSRHRMMWWDELLGWNLLTDPSWSHMLQAWKQGADGGCLLFYVLGRLVLAITGNHPVAIRLLSAVCLWAAALVWWKILSRYFSAWSASIAVLLIWLCTGDFIYHMAEARYYGLFILAVALPIYTAIWIEDRKPSPPVIFALCFLANSLLISAQMLGVLYSGMILTAFLLSQMPAQKRITAIVASVCSWIFFLPYLSIIKYGKQNSSWVQMPGLMDVVRYYYHGLTFSYIFNAAAYLFILVCVVIYRKRAADLLVQNRARLMLLYIAGLLLLLPVIFFVISHLYTPLFVSRYMMPYYLGVSCLLVLALWLVEQWALPAWRPAFRVAATAGIFCFLAVLNIRGLRQQPVRQLSSIESVLAVKSPFPTVVPDEGVYLQLKRYDGVASGNIVYLIPNKREGQPETDEMAVISNAGYAHDIYHDADFFPLHKQFLYVDIPMYRDIYQRLVAANPAWSVRDVDIIKVNGNPVHVLQFER